MNSRWSHRAASSITWLETSSDVPVGGQPVEHLPQVTAQHRVQAHRRLVEDQQVRAAEQRDGKAHPGKLAAGVGANEAAFQARRGRGTRPWR